MEGKSRKIKILIGLIALIVLAFGSFKSKDTKTSENVNTAEVNLKKVIVGLPGISNQTLEATGIAVNKGYMIEELKKVGYEPEFIYFQQAGPAVNEALATNKIDVAMYGDFRITILKSNGRDVKVFAVDNSRFMYGVLVQNDDNIKTIKDLEGKKVLYRKGTVEQKFFKEILKNYNLDEDKFISVNAGGADGQSIFSAKEAEAIFTFYYTALYMESKGLGKVIDSTLDKPEVGTQSLVVGKSKFLEENPDAAVAIIKALKRAKDFAKENPEEVFNIYAQNGIPAEVYKKSLLCWFNFL